MYLTIAHLDFISPTSKSKILRKWDTLGTRPCHSLFGLVYSHFYLNKKSYTATII